MRTLAEILEDAEDGGTPEYDELRYAVLALNALITFDGVSMVRAASDKTMDHSQALQDHIRRVSGARSTHPKLWLGWENDPENPEHQERRRAAAASRRRQLH